MPKPTYLDPIATFATRVNEREKRSRPDRLRHARQQGADLRELRQMVKEKGLKWEEFVETNLTLGLTQTKAYIRFAESSSVTDDEETQWKALQQAQGNRSQASLRKSGANQREKTEEEEVDDALVKFILPPEMANELEPVLKDLRAQWGVVSATIEAIRQAGKEVARG